MVNYGKHNGFLSNQVYDIFQDKKGFIWIANDYGLNRYDGVNLKTYYCRQQTSLPGSHIRQDAEGRIWYMNFDGNLYYVQNETMHALKQNPTKGYIPYGITAKHIFVFQKAGLDIYDIKSLSLIKHMPKQYENLEYATAYGNNFYWLQDENICTLDSTLNIRENNFFKDKKLPTKIISTYKNTIIIASKYNNGGYIYQFDKALQNIGMYKCADANIILGLKEDGGDLWVSTNRGTFNVTLAQNRATPKQRFLEQSSVSSLLIDRQGNHWFSTVNDGVFFKPSYENDLFKLPGYNFNGMLSTGKEFFLSTSHGKLYSYKPGSELRLISSDPGNHELYYMYYDPAYNNLFYTNSTFNIANNLNFNNIQVKLNALKSICRIDNKYYAIAGSGAAGFFKNNQCKKGEKSKWDSLISSLPVNKGNEPLVNYITNRAKSVVYDSINTALYYLDNLGMFELTPKQFKRLLIEGESFFGKRLVYFQKKIYILSARGELYTYQFGGTFQPLSEKLGLQQDEILNIKNAGAYLLIIGKRYLYLVDSTGQINAMSGLPLPVSEVIDVLIEKDNLYLLTESGIFRSAVIINKTDRQDVRFVINRISSGNLAFTLPASIDLPFSNSGINIEFSLLDFRQDQLHRLEYSLDGENWKLLGYEVRNIEFSRLASGRYNVKFKLNNKILDQTVQFSIIPPFYQQWWFVLLIAAFISVGFWAYLQYRKRHFEKQLALLKEKIQLEKELGRSVLTAVKSQMNPHFFYNALNSIQSFLFSNDKRNASNYLAKFSRLTRMILEMSDKETIKLREEIEALTLYLELENMRFDEELKFELTVEDLDTDLVKIPSMMIQPYVENAIKHGLLHSKEEKHLSIRMSKEEHLLKVEIEDNGIGRTRSAELNKIKSDKHQSYATAANLKRLEILNKDNKNIKPMSITDKYDDTGKACGTVVELYMPIS